MIPAKSTIEFDRETRYASPIKPACKLLSEPDLSCYSRHVEGQRGGTKEKNARRFRVTSFNSFNKHTRGPDYFSPCKLDLRFDNSSFFLFKSVD